MSEAADILIVGAGVAGLGVAARLAGEARVVVLEAMGAACTQTSGRSAAMYLKTYGPPAVRALTDASEGFYTDPGDGFADGPLLSPRGVLHLDDRGGDGVRKMVAADPNVSLISAEEALALTPILKLDEVDAIGLEAAARDIDIDRLTGGWLREARALGAALVTDAQVSALSRAGGVWRAETPAGAFEAPVVVNATGAWAGEVGALAGATPIAIEPRRRSAAIVPLPDGMDPRGWAMFLDISETFYARPSGGALMVSSAEAIPTHPHDIQIDKYDEILVGGLDRYQHKVTTEITSIHSPWAGLRSFSPDGEPVAGFDPIAEGFFWLAGQGGYGFQTAPALSRLAADLVLAKSHGASDWLVKALSPKRFARD